MPNPGPPLALLAELTHRCPLQCPYCSNPLELEKAGGELATDDWLKLFDQAADLGVLQVHLSGGEPTLRTDVEDFVRRLAGRGVYTNLITAGVTLDGARIAALASVGLDHVQISFQGADPETTERIGRYPGAYDKKLIAAREVRNAGLPLTINAPIHRDNAGQLQAFIELALALDADRLEIANVQYYGWAYLNRAALLPDITTIRDQAALVESERERLKGILNIDYVTPDYYADYPKPCMGGWARDAMVVVPDGRVLPCHAAATIPALAFDKVTERSLADIWETSEALERYRGFDWMQEPCRSCPRRETDFGGCRCQAFAVTGNAAATDPACRLSPHHGELRAQAQTAGEGRDNGFIYRRIGAISAGS